MKNSNGMQKHTNNNIEISRAPQDRVKTVLAVGNYETEISNDDGIKYHERHRTSNALQAMSKENVKTGMLLQPPPPPPEPLPRHRVDRNPAHFVRVNGY